MLFCAILCGIAYLHLGGFNYPMGIIVRNIILPSLFYPPTLVLHPPVSVVNPLKADRFV